MSIHSLVISKGVTSSEISISFVLHCQSIILLSFSSTTSKAIINRFAIILNLIEIRKQQIG
nr:MAG TPA: hypothetical protein [Caudoviricetes sp.]DAT34346.1 MAG TPA: hypothetical protein [Caudoviricetes sp.]